MYSASWSYQFSSSIQDVWREISDTEAESRVAGMPPVQFETQARQEGGSVRTGSFRLAGMALKWIENPYEWLAPRYYQVERVYLGGPLKKVSVFWEMEPNEKGTFLKQTIEVEPRNKILAPLFILQVQLATKLGFLKFYSNVEKKSKALRAEPFPSLPEPRVDKKVFKKLLERLHQAKVEDQNAQFLLRWLFSAADLDLYKIRPFRMAKVWGRDKMEVLSLFLRATQAGVFVSNWDILCPSCRGTQAKFQKLSLLPNESHCNSCNIKFGVDFDQQVELTFFPNSDFRPVKVLEYCVGGPGNTPHYWMQKRIKPGETYRFSTELPKGSFRIRSLQSKMELKLLSQEELQRSEAETFRIDFGAAHEPEEVSSVLAGKKLDFELHNSENHEITAALEKTEWLDDVCTGSFLLTCQEFRSLFSSEVLNPTQEIRVSGVALLFTDLSDSTQLYQRLGEAQAFQLVNRHFDLLSRCVRDENGTVVKTIGDAVMAAFHQPEQAIKAALQMQKSVLEAHQSGLFKEKIALKIGIHFGPCFIVSVGDRMDYFGTTVNVAARAQTESKGGEIMLSGKMIEDPGVKQVLMAQHLQAVQQTRKLKGLTEEFELYQVTL